MLLMISWQSADSFKGAIAVWDFSDLNDKTPENSILGTHGDVRFISLSREEANTSKARGGDGKAADFRGGWLDAGQGINSELNLTGENISLLVRVKPGEITGYTPLINKAGNDQNIAYALFFNRRDGEAYIESKMGSDDIGGAHLLKYKIPAGEENQWFDILLRFNGTVSHLYINGILRDDEITVGDIRDWNKRPFLIGAQYKQPYGYANASEEQIEAKFKGLIDHVAVWNCYLADAEVAKLSGVNTLSNGKPVYYSEIYRPQFHFSAQKNWLNDPNGLVYYDGVYHMFFQYMPPHRPGAYKDWGHAVSTDLVHWEQTPDHITPHKVWSGCWSGSAVVDVNNTAGFQTGDKKAIIAFITNGGNPRDGIGSSCTQCIAYSNDGGKTFTYYDQNPVICNIHAVNRDPKVVWDDDSKQWIMSLYMDRGYEFGFFSSFELKEWKYLSSFSLDGDAECPGFEPLPVDGDVNNKKWMLFGAKGNYRIGRFDGTNFIPETGVLRGDYGINFYAAQTWSDAPDGRCLLIAWMPTQRYPGMPFEQQMNFPTEIQLRTTPQGGVKAYRMPVKEIRNLYDKEYKWNNETLTKGNRLFQELKDELYDIDLELDINPSTSFEIGLRSVTVSYDASARTLSCGGIPVKHGIIPSDWISKNPAEINEKNNLGKAPLAPVNGKLKLRILLDRTTVEVFGNDGDVVITSCYMPQENAGGYSFSSNNDIQVVKAAIYSLKPIWK
jgi:sucrose-6-phosphate hydrolase SacC (GH32 family)